MSFQVNSKTAIIITLSLGTITLPAGLQAHQYTGTNNKADNLSLSSDPISDLKSSLPDKKTIRKRIFRKMKRIITLKTKRMSIGAAKK